MSDIPAAQITVPDRLSWRSIGGLALSGLLFAAAVGFLVYTAGKYEMEHIWAGLRDIPAWRVVAAVALSGLSYLALTLYDILGLRHLGHPLPLRHAMFVSFVAHSFSNNVGVAFLSGGSLRLRMYSSLGMEVGDVLRLIAFCNLTFVIGFVAMGGLLLVGLPPFLIHPLPLGDATLQLIGTAMLLAVCAYLLIASRRGSVRISGYTVSLPSLWMSLSQMLAASLDWIITGLILYVLLPYGAVPFGVFTGIFLAAHVAGIASNVPGGLGVFEATLLLLLAPFVREPVILGAILLYRIVYYVLPLALGVVLFCVHEARTGSPYWTAIRSRMRGYARFGRQF
jgi:phosphatidylglycerol lysyltransferase